MSTEAKAPAMQTSCTCCGKYMVTQREGTWYCHYCTTPKELPSAHDWSCAKCTPTGSKKAGSPKAGSSKGKAQSPKKGEEKNQDSKTDEDWESRPEIEKKLYNKDGTLKKRGAELTDDEAFRAAFDRNSDRFHGNTEGAQAKPIVLGGWEGKGIVPEGMKDHANWMALPEQAPEAKEEYFGEEFARIARERETLTDLKRAMVAMDPANAAIIKHVALLPKYADDEAKTASLLRIIEKQKAIRDACVQDLLAMHKVFKPGSEWGDAITFVASGAVRMSKAENAEFSMEVKRKGQAIFNFQKQQLEQMKQAKKEYLASQGK